MHPWLHFKTITRHKLLVMHYCFRAGMYKQGLLHDLSKYAPVEFLVGCKYYQGDRSPNNAEREDTGISKSWLHHKGRNKHHFEYWVDYAPGDEHIINGVPMPRKYIAEMVMDRISASRNYLGDKYDQHQPLDYYLKGKEKLWFIHPKKITPKLVWFRTPLQTDRHKAMLSDSITLTAGTITVRSQDGRLLVHALDAPLAEGIEDTAFQQQLEKMEGTQWRR